jgi:golgi apparatus protein 1
VRCGLQFCADVPPGNARAKDCLEEHKDDEGFTAGCKDEIEKMMSERAADFRLDYKLREACADDIDELCEYELAENVLDTRSRDAPVIRCLQDFRLALQKVDDLQYNSLGHFQTVLMGRLPAMGVLSS